MQQRMQIHLHELTTATTNTATTATATTKTSATKTKSLKLLKAANGQRQHCCKPKANSNNCNNNNNNTNSKNQNLQICNNNNSNDNNNLKKRAAPNTRRNAVTNATTTTVTAKAPTTTTATEDPPGCTCTVHTASSNCSYNNNNNSSSNSESGRSKMPSITLDAAVPHSHNVDSVVAVASDAASVSASTALQAAAAAAACTSTTTTVLRNNTAHKAQPPHAPSLGEQVAADAAAQVALPPATTAGPPPISALQIAAQRAAAATYGCHFQGAAATASAFLPTASSALEQYRLQLYNYALNIERLRCPQYSAAAAMAAASYASSAASGHAAAANRHNMASNGGGAYSMPVGMPPGSRLALSMSLFPQRIFQPEEPKPQHSYIGLIAMAILSSAESKLVLSDIYQYILDNYPYFRTRGPGWRNSIRHNLSLNDCFIKSGRSANGKGHYWAIHPANMDDFRKGDFRRRKAQRKVRKHMGLSVDDAGTDSPSPPPLDLSASPPAGAPHPLTAHHLAASHTFGYLQHHQQQHHHQPPHPHLGVVPASFQPPHPQPHHYIGQAFGNAAAAAAAAAAAGVPHYAYNAPPGANSNNGSSGAQQLALAQSFAYSNSNNNNTGNSSQQHNQPSQQPGDSNAAVAVAADGNQLAIINETTTTTRTATASVIANLYSQTRKRQFDVASLLAPEVKLDIVDDNCALTTIERCSPNGGIATTTQHTVITKVSVQQQQHHHHHLPYHHQPHHPHQHHYYQQQQQLSVAPAQHPQQMALPRSLLELEEQEDIDVVASDVEEHQRQPSTADMYADVDGDGDGDGDGDTDADAEAQQFAEADASSYLSTSRRSSIDGCATDAANSSRRQSPLSDAAIELHTLQLPNAASAAAAYELHSNSLSSQPDSLECTTLVAMAHSRDSSPNGGATQIPPLASAVAQEQHVQRLMQQLQQQQTVSSKLSGVDSHFFGRYYGTYMTAAAARRIGGISLMQLQPTIEPTQMQHQQQQRHTPQ